MTYLFEYDAYVIFSSPSYLFFTKNDDTIVVAQFHFTPFILKTNRLKFTTKDPQKTFFLTLGI